jgi:molybdopterin/thiamine biosynthesis adenylyltransferase
MREFARTSGAAALREHNLGEIRDVTVVVPRLELSGAQVGPVDVISAGALSTAMLYMLLRVPNISATLRVVDDDCAALENLNRYLLLKRDWIGRSKVDVLASYQLDRITIDPVAARLTETTAHELAPLAKRVVVGVDDIPSRWVAQRHSPGWVGVAATSHFETLVSEHNPDSACSGCLHPYTDDGPASPIPTISFVSALAGFLLAYRLVRAATGNARPDVTIAYPFNLGAERGIQTLPCAAHPKCPVQCRASRRMTTAQ